ncbi:MAG: pseudouridine synthase [Ornithinimicrobium sp.]
MSDRRKGNKPGPGGGRKPSTSHHPPRNQPRRGGAGGAAARGGAQQSQPDVHHPDGTRLQKVLAGAGWGSRRACEQLIAAGRVQVDDITVRELGVRVDPATQVIHVDGTRVVLDDTMVYLAFNKPLGVVSTMSDELGRPCLGDYFGNRTDRLFHVGRLDAETEGLLLLTNDGELSHRLQHPSYEVPKTYVAQVPGPMARDIGRRLRAGIELEDGHVKVDSFRIIDSLPGKAIVEVVLHEGKKHVVRRLLEEVGHPVLALARVQFGPIRLGEIKPGRWRALTREEVGGLHRQTQM